MKQIRFFRRKNRSSPIEEFLDGLSAKQAEKVLWVLKLIEEIDRVPSQYFKKLVGADDIWEIRVQSGNITFRLLGFLDGESVVVLTNGFTKKQQKTPKQEIRLAQQRKREYLEDRK